MEISDVVRRVLAGDRDAFSELVTHYQGPLFKYLGRMGLAQARAEEIAQEAFVRAWLHIEDFNSRRGRFSTWLYTIAHRLALNELGRHARYQEVTGIPVDIAVSDRALMEEAIESDQRRELLRAALLELPVADRSAIALAFIEGFTLAEVARIEGCTTGAIKARMHRARRKLRDILEDRLE